MNLKEQTTDTLEELKRKITEEINKRNRGPSRKYYRVMTNGCRNTAVCFKKIEDAKTELLDEINDCEIFDCAMEISALEIPELDYSLRPERWYGS